jgi:3-phenylpropionate/trans-cinnamate dioxygenase ferredoxin subunit
VNELHKYVVGPVSSVPPGSQRRVDVAGRAVAVFNVDGRYYALRDVCPHRGAALSAGLVVGSFGATAPGAYLYDPSRPLVRCPWHGWEYDLVTGQSWCDAGSRVRALQVSVESGRSMLEAGAGEERVPGPYVAETVRISVEDDYIVVEA